jgi:hypothetical protein
MEVTMQRRDFLQRASILGVALPGLGWSAKDGVLSLLPGVGEVGSTIGVGHREQGNLFFESNFERWFFRALNRGSAAGSVLGECLQAYGEIQDWHPESWIEAWATLATRVEGLARGALEKKESISARDAFLRAWNYYRAAEFMCSVADPRHRLYYDKGLECFKASGSLFSPPFEYVEYPYEDKTLPAFFLRTGVAEGPRPTLIFIPGNDGGKEEMFFWCGRAAVERGYNVLLFDGPGHRGAVHAAPEMVFRPDYEIPVGAAVDYLLTRRDVDVHRIGVSGTSFGGYLAPRAAASDERLAALIAFPPIPDVPRFFADLRLEQPTPPPEVPDQRQRLMDFLMWTWGPDYELDRWNLHGLVERISCPTLALYSEWEKEHGYNQFEDFFEDLTCEKSFHFFSHAEGAGAHVAANNGPRLHQVVFEWLSEVWK